MSDRAHRSRDEAAWRARQRAGGDQDGRHGLPAIRSNRYYQEGYARGQAKREADLARAAK